MTAAHSAEEYRAAAEEWHKGNRLPLIDLVRRDDRAILDALARFDGLVRD